MKRVSSARHRRLSLSGFATVSSLGIAAGVSSAQSPGVVDSTQSTSWTRGAIAHDQQMRMFKDPATGSQPTPPVIPKFETDGDPSGTVGTFQPAGTTITSNNTFFQNLGTNERTCFTCHQPATGWGTSAAGVQSRFAASSGQDPIFRFVDGATCPSDDVSSPQAMQQSYKLLLDKGLIRIGLPMPAAPQFSVTNVQDPYGCTTDPQTGLTSPTAGILSMSTGGPCQRPTSGF